MNKRKNTNDHIRQSLHTTGTLRYLVLGPGKPIIDGVYRASNDGKGLGFLLYLGFASVACICIGGWVGS
jgi:hypothetical protein